MVCGGISIEEHRGLYAHIESKYSLCVKVDAQILGWYADTLSACFMVMSSSTEDGQKLVLDVFPTVISVIIFYHDCMWVCIHIGGLCVFLFLCKVLWISSCLNGAVQINPAWLVAIAPHSNSVSSLERSILSQIPKIKQCRPNTFAPIIQRIQFLHK